MELQTQAAILERIKTNFEMIELSYLILSESYGLPSAGVNSLTLSTLIDATKSEIAKLKSHTQIDTSNAGGISRTREFNRQMLDTLIAIGNHWLSDAPYTVPDRGTDNPNKTDHDLYCE